MKKKEKMYKLYLDKKNPITPKWSHLNEVHSIGNT